MSAHTLDADVNLFRKKDESSVFTGMPRHGSVAWRRVGSEWVELIYWQLNSFGGIGWVTIEEFRDRKRNKKSSNNYFYRLHPHLLREKINAKRGNRRELRVFKSIFDEGDDGLSHDNLPHGKIVVCVDFKHDTGARHVTAFMD